MVKKHLAEKHLAKKHVAEKKHMAKKHLAQKPLAKNIWPTNTFHIDNVGIYYKHVCLSKPVKVTDNRKDTSLLHKMSFSRT